MRWSSTTLVHLNLEIKYGTSQSENYLIMCVHENKTDVLYILGYKLKEQGPWRMTWPNVIMSGSKTLFY